ncbi:hypothetical protein L6164_020783 [Bauhinia variegata]|uniref:Uncharacterized protein n=1 Tax=Bauhinia variegata TaxID=167791 RepID=A0ACB9MZM8_BAUVA|nr:hypothetical protein L6164_020783 [Bauhinia variegata]
MQNPVYNSHVKLLAFDLLSLTQTPSPSSSASNPVISFSLRGIPISRAETLGTVTYREYKPCKFLKFSIDDGTGLVNCILWLNQLTSAYFARRRSPPDVRLIAESAAHFADLIKLGVVARVRGKLTNYRGTVQITVSDVFIERDPNAEILHWLDCINLASKCYDVLPLARQQRNQKSDTCTSTSGLSNS